MSNGVRHAKCLWKKDFHKLIPEVSDANIEASDIRYAERG